jgi:hypothetical protein
MEVSGLTTKYQNFDQMTGLSRNLSISYNLEKEKYMPKNFNKVVPK